MRQLAMASLSPSSLSGQLWRYLVTGLINTALGLSVIFALHLGAGINLIAANAAGYAAGWLVSFGLNRSWTFRHSGAIRRSLPAYLVLVVIAFSMTIWIISALLSLGLAYVAAQIAGAVFYSSFIFLGAKYVVFFDRA